MIFSPQKIEEHFVDENATTVRVCFIVNIL